MLIPLTPVRFFEYVEKIFAPKEGVICESERFTYGQFCRRVRKMSNALARFGVRKGDRVAYPLGSYPFAEDDPAEIFYTSGTTGKPKGVMLPHRNLYLHALCAMSMMTVRETDVQIHLIPLFHVNSWGTPHYLLAKGGKHVMVKRFDPVKTLELIQKEKVTPEEFIQHARDNMAHFKAPREVRIIPEFPKGGTGKILKSVLREKYRGA